MITMSFIPHSDVKTFNKNYSSNMMSFPSFLTVKVIYIKSERIIALNIKSVLSSNKIPEPIFLSNKMKKIL